MWCFHDWRLISKLSSLPLHYGQRFIFFLHTKEDYVRYCRKCGKQQVNMGGLYFWKWREIWNLKEGNLLETINILSSLPKKIQDKYGRMANDDLKREMKKF